MTLASSDAWWDEAADRLARLLPAQGPISIFIHHNTLHAFEALDFEAAAVAAGRKLSCQAFLAEEDYRRHFDRGRITDRDLDWALRQALGAGAEEPVCDGVSRLELRARLARYGIPEAGGTSLTWLLDETAALRRWRDDLPGDARQALGGSDSGEEAAVRALWDACLAVASSPELPKLAPSPAAPARHRDLLLAVAGIDTDSWIQPVLIRVVGAFLDQGLSRWTLPGRAQGLYSCFLELYSRTWAALCGPWARALPRLLDSERRAGLSAVASIRRSLEALGVREDERIEYLEATAVSLRGWAGMIRQLEERPDRVPTRSLPASLAEYFAVRLLLERAALGHAARALPSFGGDLSKLREHLRQRLRPEGGRSAPARAWRLFHAAQLCGFSQARLKALPKPEASSLLAELDAFEGVAVRSVLHAAYERHLRSRLCDALTAHAPFRRPAPPAFQTISCLDEREESFRRHLEEAAPDAETFGAAGFYGVAMYYQGATDAHPRPLCPIAIQPRHYVGEVKVSPTGALVRWRRARRRGTGAAARLLHSFGGTFFGGAVLSTLAGPVSLVPLIFRVVFPGLARRWGRVLPFSRKPATRLVLDRRKQKPPMGEVYGFTKDEMAGIVAGLLRGIGLTEGFAPLVVVLGHGSTSLNNPHESAYDCGACGGGRGGPNARAFAQMANDPAVRALLADQGLAIPDGTRFLGGQRNTSDNSVELYDLDLLPAGHAALFDRVATAFAHVRRNEAHERCRRFETFPLSGGRGASLSHVEERAQDLAQPRTELGHATNAFCVVGRRDRTRGLFLDRRAFLVSYDPARDDDGSILERSLAAAVPVVAGISLEYYFSRVDPSGYGCGTKLPHNVASLLGVMDGAQSDLRTGLPWQMVEVHEPVRLFVVVEAAPQRLDSVLERLPGVRRLLDRRWLFAACLEPGSQTLLLREDGRWLPWKTEEPLPRVAGDSIAWYKGRRDHLPIAELGRA